MHPNGSHQRWFYAVIVVFLLFFFAAGIRHQIAHSVLGLFHHHHTFPDFSRYVAFRTLSEDEFPTDDDSRRVIIVGDIHGMDKPFHALLDKLSYDPKSDVLIHVGDTVSRGPISGSMAVLSYMAANNITGVRGNHDQKAIEWRTWLNWISEQKGGLNWLNKKYMKWLTAESNGVDLESWIVRESTTDKAKWWKKIPKGWQLFGDHYKVAHAMSHSEYEYLLSCPLSLYIPSSHTFIVHAGLLSSDPRRESTHPRQPLSHIPILPTILEQDKVHSDHMLSRLRRLQELSILHDIPQNTDPWVLLNIRGVRDDHTITRKNRGTSWSKLWNKDMSRCGGFEVLGQSKDNSLPCYPSTVVFGHAAARGLDIKRWSMGLDTGCVYGRRLTALVVGPKSSSDQAQDTASKTDQDIPFGDDGKARITSIRC